MLRWIANNIDSVQEHSVALPRFWVHGNGSGGWEISDCRTIGGTHGADYQARLFRPSVVVPIDTIHTRGFEASTTMARGEARIYHFDWIVRNYDDRLRKIEHYEELAKGSTKNLTGYYLPEERDRSQYDFIPLEDRIIETTCAHLNPPMSSKCEVGNERCQAALNEVERFDHLGVKLEIPKHLVTPSIRRALREGCYETLEANMIAKFMRPSDIVLELGAAIGFLSTWISQRLTTGTITSYEANPSLINVALNTFRINSVNVTLKNAIVIGSSGGEVAEFFVHKAFWASGQIENGGTKIEVATEGVPSILQRVKPDILVIDIEGGEVELFGQVELRGVRHVLIELHAGVTGPTGIRKVFQRMSELGFAYDSEYSSSYVVTFSPLQTV
jgi:FkbM family methyltransferase